MIDLEAYLVLKIAERCKALRLNSGISMERIADRSSVSRIENAKIPKIGNFITETVLLEYANLFNKSPKEIIFGNERELEETLEWLFGKMFRLIRLKNLDTDIDLYNGKDNIDVTIQKAVLSMAETFAEYNLKRHNFLKTNDTHMDIIDKSLDCLLWSNGELINIERDFKNEPISEATVIDLSGMRDNMWLVCKKKIISSFKGEVIDVIINDFKFSSINSLTYEWIIHKFIKIIVPAVIEKLKSVVIFKIGFMVKKLIDEFLDEDLSISFQNTVPLKVTRPESYQIKFNTTNLCTLLEDNKEPIEIISEIMRTLQEGEVPFEKYSHYGITIKKVPEVTITDEIEIENILNRAINNRGIDRTLNNPPVVEMGPIFSTSDFNSVEDMELAFEEWYENKHFKNQNIPGYLTNNSQILNSLQNRMNKNTYELIDEYIDIQNNLLKLLTKEDLEKFSV